MKNRIFITLAAVAVAASMAAPVVSQAAEGSRPVRKGYVIVGSGSGVSVNEITDDQLKQKLNIEEIINTLCPGNKGGGQNKPDNQPDTDVPEAPDIPETPDVPDIDKPDTDNP